MADEAIPELVQPSVTLYPYDIALIIDDTVFQVLNVDGQAAAQFMAQPRFVRVTSSDNVKIGWKHINGSFVPPEEFSTGL